LYTVIIDLISELNLKAYKTLLIINTE
jgi:hypothetical protein